MYGREGHQTVRFFPCWSLETGIQADRDKNISFLTNRDVGENGLKCEATIRFGTPSSVKQAYSLVTGGIEKKLPSADTAFTIQFIVWLRGDKEHMLCAGTGSQRGERLSYVCAGPPPN